MTPFIINLHGAALKSYRGRDCDSRRIFAWHTGCLVADVDYKTAPEQKYPYAQLEGYRVVEYFRAHAAQYRLDPDKIILSGRAPGGQSDPGDRDALPCREQAPIRQLIMAYPPLDLYKGSHGETLCRD